MWRLQKARRSQLLELEHRSADNGNHNRTSTTTWRRQCMKNHYRRTYSQTNLPASFLPCTWLPDRRRRTVCFRQSSQDLHEICVCIRQPSTALLCYRALSLFGSSGCLSSTSCSSHSDLVARLAAPSMSCVAVVQSATKTRANVHCPPRPADAPLTPFPTSDDTDRSQTCVLGLIAYSHQHPASGHLALDHASDQAAGLCSHDL